MALKLIDKKKLTSPKIRQKVDREISNMEKLRHGNIVEIFESKFSCQLNYRTAFLCTTLTRYDNEFRAFSSQ